VAVDINLLACFLKFRLSIELTQETQQN